MHTRGNALKLANSSPPPLDVVISATNDTSAPALGYNACPMPPLTCRGCAIVLEDDNPTGYYCLRCNNKRLRRWRAARRRARLTRWYQELQTADAERTAILTSEIISRLGGYDQAASEIVTHVRTLASSPKAKERIEAMRCYRSLIQLMRQVGQ